MGRGKWKAAVSALPASIRAQTREEEKMKEDYRRERPYVRRFKRKAFRRMILKVAVLLLLVVMLTMLLFFAAELKGNLKVNKNNAGSIKPDEIVDEPKEPDMNQPSMEKEWKEQLSLPEIERPISRSDEEVLERLKELGQSIEEIQSIYVDHKKYPVEMLAALANNPEMADFVLGYLEEKAYEVCLTEQEKEADYPLFLQWDKRWGYHAYGSSNIGLTGCGPTALSMVLYYLTGDDKYTPDYIGDYSMKNGYYVEGSGTSWELMLDYPKKCGLCVNQPALMENKLISLLDMGQVIICAMRRGDFTASGHFIVIYGYDETGFLVNDPNCIYRSQRTWTYDELQWQIKSIWAYGNNRKDVNSVFERPDENIYFIEGMD